MIFHSIAWSLNTDTWLCLKLRVLLSATTLHSQALSNTRYTVQNTSIYSFQLKHTDDTNDLPKINKGETNTGVKRLRVNKAG